MPDSGKKRIAILGATGCVGRTILGLLETRPDCDFVLAARHGSEVERLAADSPATCVPVVADARYGPSLHAMLREGVDLLVNCAGQYRATGMAVAREAVESGVDLIDIGDEPVYIREVLHLEARAKAQKCRLLIGSGTAPQTTGALVRMATAPMKAGYEVTVGACFGVNRVGSKAVRTAAEAVGGRLSLPGAPPIWGTIRPVAFSAPFGSIMLRNYALPETVYLPELPGVDQWHAGVALPENWQNETVAFLRRTGFAEWMAKSSWMCPAFAGTVSTIETWMASHKIGHLGIALYVEARNGNHAVIGTLHHSDMSSLTAYALALTVEQEFLQPAAEPKWGIQLAHECVDPKQFLDRLRTFGASWELRETGSQFRAAGNG